MKSVICKQGETQSGQTVVTFYREGSTLVIKDVPAEICSNCGEDYVDSKITSLLLRLAEEAVRAGIQVDVRQYKAAA